LSRRWPSGSRGAGCWTVILAMGAQHRRLEIPGEEQLAGRRLSYCATWDAAFFRNVPTLIVVGGDSAMEVRGIDEIDNGTSSTDKIL
jgi:thioredoxin reductase